MHGIHDEHIAREQPIDDDSPHCFIGGAELNVLAGSVVYARHHDDIHTVICAYGGRSHYLVEADAPSECSILTKRLRYILPKSAHSKITLWPRERQAQSGKTNTWQEIQNIFELALQRSHTSVGLVTVEVHYARALLMAREHLKNSRFAALTLQCFASENILLEIAPSWRPRLQSLFGSQAYLRTLYLEQRGINCLLAGKY